MLLASICVLGAEDTAVLVVLMAHNCIYGRSNQTVQVGELYWLWKGGGEGGGELQ